MVVLAVTVEVSRDRIRTDADQHVRVAVGGRPMTDKDLTVPSLRGRRANAAKATNSQGHDDRCDPSHVLHPQGPD